jgi:hypothetical protein
MSTTARLRLYQYAYSPYCIPIEMALRHSGVPYETVDLPVCDPRAVLELTQGECYHVPVIEDLFNRKVIWDKGPEENDVARYVVEVSPLMNLFPIEVAGWQQILLRYIEDYSRFATPSATSGCITTWNAGCIAGTRNASLARAAWKNGRGTWMH